MFRNADAKKQKKCIYEVTRTDIDFIIIYYVSQSTKR